MNADEIVRALREMATYDCGFETESDIVTEAALVIESLQAQLAESQRRERAAVEALNKISDYNGSLICRCNEILKIANEWRGPQEAERGAAG